MKIPILAAAHLASVRRGRPRCAPLCTKVQTILAPGMTLRPFARAPYPLQRIAAVVNFVIGVVHVWDSDADGHGYRYAGELTNCMIES